MAQTFNNAPARNIGSDLTTIYQATVKTIVICCLMTNKTAGYLPIKVVQRSAAGVDSALPGATVRGHAGVDVVLEKKIVLLPGESLLASCPIAGAFDSFISVLEGIS